MRLQLPFVLLITCCYGVMLSHNCEDGVMMTPTYGISEGVFTICAQNTINSHPDAIYNVLADFPSYHLWNTFTYPVELPANVTSAKTAYVKMPMILHTSGLVAGLNTTTNAVVTFLSPDAYPAFVAWRFDPGSGPGIRMQSETVHALHDMGNGQTVHINWETFYGSGSVLALGVKENLETQFKVQADELKSRVEGLHLL